MPVIQDYKCCNCSTIVENMIDNPMTCFACGGTMVIYFGGWSSLAIDPRYSERTDNKGNIRQFSALDDPLCCAQMGLATDRGLASFAKVEPEKQKEFREKLIKDGDSPKLRREVLREYNKAVGGKYDLCE